MRKFVECRVCGHAFEIERFESEDGKSWDKDFGDDVSLTIWYPGFNRLNWRERLDSVWRLLTGRQPMGEHVTLELDDATELGRYLLAISSSGHPNDSVSVSQTNATVSYVSGIRSE